MSAGRRGLPAARAAVTVAVVVAVALRLAAFAARRGRRRADVAHGALPSNPPRFSRSVRSDPDAGRSHAPDRGTRERPTATAARGIKSDLCNRIDSCTTTIVLYCRVCVEYCAKTYRIHYRDETRKARDDVRRESIRVSYARTPTRNENRTRAAAVVAGSGCLDPLRRALCSFSRSRCRPPRRVQRDSRRITRIVESSRYSVNVCLYSTCSRGSCRSDVPL